MAAICLIKRRDTVGEFTEGVFYPTERFSDLAKRFCLALPPRGLSRESQVVRALGRDLPISPTVSARFWQRTGGCSTGRKTAEGRARIAASNQMRAQARAGHTVPLTPLFPKWFHFGDTRWQSGTWSGQAL